MEKEKIAYVLSACGKTKAVIIAENQKELKQKTCLAIQEEENAEEDSVVVKMGRMGDWGEDTTILAEYSMDGFEKIINNEYTLTKTATY